MNAYRLAVSFSWWVIVALTIIALSACSTPGTGPAPTAILELPTSAPVSHSTPIVPPVVTPLSRTATWKTYKNDRAGYTIKYPADWGVDERIESDGAKVTVFVPPGPDNDGIALSVIVRNGASFSGEIPDMPNTRCQPVTVDQLSGTRCFDTIAFSTTTTLAGQGKVYILAGSGKRLEPNIYQHFLDSFAVTA